MAEVFQGSFTGGELAPSLWGRVDIPTFQASLKLCRNMVIQPYGGAKNRGGTLFVAEAKISDKKTRLIPFSYSSTDTAILEFGHLYMRVHVNGAPLLYPADYPVVDKQGLPVEVVTDYTESELFDIDYRQIADVVFLAHGDHKVRRIERYDTYTWTIADAPYKLGPWGPLNTVTGEMITASATTGDITLTSTNAGVFSADNSGQLMRLESQNFAEPWEPNKAVTAGVQRRCDGKVYEALTSGTTGTLRPVQFSDNWHDGGVNWKYLHSGFGVVELGSTITNGGKTINATVKSTLPTDVSGTLTPGTSWTAVSVTATDHPISEPGRWWLVEFSAPHGFTDTWTLVTIVLTFGTVGNLKTFKIVQAVTVHDTTTVEIDAKQIEYTASSQPFYSGSMTLGEVEPAGVGTYVWQFGAWSDHLGWPKTVNFWQQRLVLGGSNTYPTTMWLSRSDSFDDFGENNPIQSDDAITYSIASAERNQIEAIVSLKKLMAITKGGVWVFNSGQEDIVTPNNIAASLECYEGGSKQRVLGIGRSAIYLQDKGMIPRDLAYTFAEDGYSAGDMTVYANHLFKGHTIVDWCYQSHPFKVIWAVRDDGALLGCTYMREHSVMGWHRHDSYTTLGAATFESCVSISEGDEIAVYFVVKRRRDDGSYTKYIERLSNREDAECFLDCSVKATRGETAAVVPHLAGQKVRIKLGTGVEQDAVVLEDGSIPAGVGTFWVGYPVISDMELLTVNAPQQGAARQTNKLVTGVQVLLEEAQQLYAGASYSALQPIDAASSDSFDGTTISGIAQVTFASTWGKMAPVVFRHTKAAPLSILAVIPEVSIGS